MSAVCPFGVIIKTWWRNRVEQRENSFVFWVKFYLKKPNKHMNTVSQLHALPCKYTLITHDDKTTDR